METAIGVVKTLIGNATATGADGVERPLQIGDIIRFNDVITTGSLGALEVELNDGSIMALGRQSQLTVNEDVYPAADQVENQPVEEGDDVASIQQSLEEGADPTQVGDAPAAGEGEGDPNGVGSLGLTQVDFDPSTVTPVAGFETDALNANIQNRTDEELIVAAEQSQGTGTQTQPSIGDTEATILDEEGLSSSASQDDGYAGDVAGISIANTANLAIDWGDNDGAARQVLFNEQVAPAGLTSDGEPLTYTISEASTLLTATAGGRTVFTIKLSADGSGSYEFTLLDNLDHSISDIEDNIDLNFNFIATDSDGVSTEPATFSVSVNDDAPVIGEASTSFTVPSFTLSSFDDVSSAGFANSYGYYIKDADGNPTRGVIVEDNVKDRDGLYETPVTVTGYSPEQIGFFIIPNGGNLNAGTIQNGQAVKFEFNNGQWRAYTEDGTELKATGSKVMFDSASLNKDGQEHVTDNELSGNQNWEDLGIYKNPGDFDDVNTNVEWAEQTVLGSIVDEEGLELSANQDDGFDGDAVGAGLAVGGDLSISWGADDGASKTLNFDEVVLPEGLTSKGENVEYTFNADKTELTATAGSHVVFTVVLNADESGSYKFNLFDSLDHPQVNTEDDITLNFAFKATDTDGDSAVGRFSVTVDDDAPVISLSESSDTTYQFSASNDAQTASAGFKNSYGYYVKDAEGNPSIGVILEDNVKDLDGLNENALTITGYGPDEVGFFIIPNGKTKNGDSIEDGMKVKFELVDGKWQVSTENGLVLDSSTPTNVFFDDGAFNIDGKDHVIDNKFFGNQNWEDLGLSWQSGDFDDVNTNVDWTQVKVTGDVLQSVAFGADGEGTIDFLFDETNVSVNGTITSNGKAVTFEAKDSDNDGQNDQIVGVTEDNTEVLTIDGVLDGDYNVSILAPLDENNDDASVDIAAQVTATDGDGDTAFQALNININIDVNHLLANSSVE